MVVSSMLGSGTVISSLLCFGHYDQWWECVSDDDKTHYPLKFGNIRIGRLNCHSLLYLKDDVAWSTILALTETWLDDIIMDTEVLLVCLYYVQLEIDVVEGLLLLDSF